MVKLNGRKIEMKQSQTPQMFTIDLSKIEGKGDFPCPNCGVIISPEDETDNVYTVVDTKVSDSSSVEELTLQCNKCGSKIRLVGFLLTE